MLVHLPAEEYSFDILHRIHTCSRDPITLEINFETSIDYQTAFLNTYHVKPTVDFSELGAMPAQLDIVVRRGLRLYAAPEDIEETLRSLHETFTRYKKREHSMPGNTTVPETAYQFYRIERAELGYHEEQRSQWKPYNPYASMFCLDTARAIQPPGFIYKETGLDDGGWGGSAPDIAWRIRSGRSSVASPDWNRVIKTYREVFDDDR